MNKGCCKRCAKEMIESIEGKFYRQYCPNHDERYFHRWFDILWKKCGKKAPCRWLTHVEGETENEIILKEYYHPFDIEYHYVRRTVAPDKCPYLLEHVVTYD